MYYATPVNENYGGFNVYVRGKTIKALGELYRRSYADKPNQEFVVYRGKPLPQNFHGYYSFKDGKFKSTGHMSLESLLGEVFS